MVVPDSGLVTIFLFSYSLPPDVRKVSDLPKSNTYPWGFAPKEIGAQPQWIE
jgi:hypothetical protein